jgi:hypothetical protein
MSATQKPISGSAFGASVGQAAWKTIPSWYVIAQAANAPLKISARYQSPGVGTADVATEMKRRPK